jgi:hypothetical protein
MLAVAKEEGKESIVSWQPHGRAFRVHNRELFSTMIMPRFFKQTKYKSFQRQLHLWDFKRIAQGEDGGAYFHQYFLLGQPDQCKLMCRTKIKGTQMQAEDVQDPSMDFPDAQLELFNLFNAIQNAENARLLSMLQQRQEYAPVDMFSHSAISQSSPIAIPTPFDFRAPALSLPAPPAAVPSACGKVSDSAFENSNLVSEQIMYFSAYLYRTLTWLVESCSVHSRYPSLGNSMICSTKQNEMDVTT